MYILTVSFIDIEISHYIVAPTLFKVLAGLGHLRSILDDYNGDIGVKLELELKENNSLVLDGFIANENAFEVIKESILDHLNNHQMTYTFKPPRDPSMR